MKWEEAIQDIYLREIFYHFRGIKFSKKQFIKKLQNLSCNTGWDKSFYEECYEKYLQLEPGQNTIFQTNY